MRQVKLNAIPKIRTIKTYPRYISKFKFIRIKNYAKDLETAKRLLQEHFEELKKDFGVKSIAIFGSYARGENRITSDIDIFVELEKPIGLNIVSLKEKLEEILGISVDLTTLNTLKNKPMLWESVKKDVVYIL